MFWTLELASFLEDAPWPATKDELIDYAIRSGAPIEVVENLQELEDEGDVYETIEDIWPDYPTQDDFLFNEDEYSNSQNYFSIFSITVCVTPVKLNPPSWNKFCMVTKRVKSLNKVIQ